VRKRSEEVRAGRLGIYHDEREVPQEVRAWQGQGRLG
jgi:hypothetical protein